MNLNFKNLFAIIALAITAMPITIKADIAQITEIYTTINAANSPKAENNCVASENEFDTDDKADIKKAQEIMAEFCNTMKEFFNKQNKESLRQHSDRIFVLIGSFGSLATLIEKKFKVSKSTKQGAFYVILRDIQKSLQEVHSALETRNIIKAVTAFKTNLSKGFVNSLKNKFEKAKELTSENERKLLDKIAQDADSTLQAIPSDLACVGIITSVLKRQ